MKKMSPFGAVCILFILLICGTSWIVAEKSSTNGSYGGITLYVGGTSPGNYSSIQDAINASSNGDTIFVYDESSPYYEHLVVDKTINLIGEDKNSTVINAAGVENVVIITASLVNITNFTMGNGQNGIFIHSSCNIIMDNIIKWNRDDGILLSNDSDGNTIKGNIISCNNNGIYLSENSNNNITGNIIFNNYGNGIQEIDSNNNKITSNIIKSNYYDGVHLKGNYGGIINGNTISDAGYQGDGIDLFNCDYYNIIGNTISNNTNYGIYLYYYSSHNVIKSNTISNNGIHIEYNENTISDNIISNTFLRLKNIRDNNIINNSFFKGGLSISESYHNSIYNNSVNGKPIVFLEDKSNIIIDSMIAGQIIIINCNNITIRNQEISNTTDGIILSATNNSLISGNMISNNFYGIYLSLSNNNTIKNNTIISNNWDGINIDSYSNNNTIYHNNFINNTAQDSGNNIWDDGKKGNYWSNYKEKYPDAHKLLLKGIWNTPYEINLGDNKDNYPLIKQWPDSRTRTINRNMATFNSLFYWFLERFPILERLLNFL